MPDIDDPFQPRDSVVRPRPGAGRRGAGDTLISSRAPAAPQAMEAEPLPPGAQDLLGAGLNPLARAASPLLLLAGRLRGTLMVPDVGAVRHHAVEEIRRFEDRARALGVGNEVVLAARYALCATLDEAVLSTPWGGQSEWAQQTLLVVLHREAWGGEKFFEMLDRISRDPARHIDLMELQYLCVAVGFCGKYAVREGGQARLAEVRRDLYRRIREQRGNPDPALSLRWRGLEDRRNPVIRYVPWWVVGAAALAVLVVAFAVYQTLLGRAAAPIEAQLVRVGLEAFEAPAKPAAVRGPTLKQLLATDEAAGNLTVDEQNGRSVITLLGSALFASGSEKIAPSFEPVLQRVASALARVPGRVLVVGHTDDQPLRSFRFSDNFELSRERARSVVNVLQQGTGTSRSMSVVGVGSSQPKYLPASDPQNRARNRRVEIVHIAGS